MSLKRINLRSLRAPLVLVAALGLLLALAPKPGALAADAAPSFSLDKLGGGTVSSSALKGKIVVLNFFRTFCPYCVREVSELNAVDKSLGSKGVEVLGVGMDSRDKLARYARLNSVRYPVLVCTEEVQRAYGDIPGTGGLRGVPTTIIIDRSGKVSRVFLGATSEGELERQVKALLAPAGD